MKLKKGLIAAAAVLVLAVPATAFAASSTSSTAVKIRGLFGIDSSKLTDAQKADVTDYAKQMADLQKSLLDKMVSDGAMTQAQADTQKAKIDSNLANGNISIGGGFGGPGASGQPGNGGPGGWEPGQKGLGFGIGGNIDTSKLTSDQQNTLLTLQKEQLTQEKDLTNVLVEQQLITQAQADAMNAKIDDAITGLSTSNSSNDLLKGSVGGFGMLQGVTLTDAQKTAILGWASNAATVEKEIVSFYKDAGLITQAQADTANSQIDTRAKDPMSSLSMNNGMMDGRGHMGGRH